MNKHAQDRYGQIEAEKKKIFSFLDMPSLTRGQRGALSQRLLALVNEQAELDRGESWLNLDTHEHVTLSNIVSRDLLQAQKVMRTE